MALPLTPDQETELDRISARTGQTIDELVREAVDLYLSEEARFQAALEASQHGSQHGDSLPASEVWASIEREFEF